jgi:phenylacetic acid degradation protein paaN
MCRNLAFSLALYSGQMCTAPQNLLIPADGIDTDQGHKSVADVVAALSTALDGLLGEDARAVEVLGSVVSDAVLGRLDEAASNGEVLVPSRTVTHPEFGDARVRTPLVLGLTAAETDVYERECFGPVAHVVTTAGTEESIRLFRDTARRHGAMTASVYSTSDEVLGEAREAALDVGVALSENLLGGVFVNQSASFSDFHGTGANPAANASFTDGAFVAPRFRIVQSRRHV